MTVPFVSPGGVGIPDKVVSGPVRPHFFPRKVLAGGGAQMFRPMVSGATTVTIVVRGLNTVADHAAAVDAMVPGAIAIIHQVTGEFSVVEAQRAITEMGAIDTGNTRDSIHAQQSSTRHTVQTHVGPRTFYAPLIVFGLGPHFTYGPRDFMSASFAVVMPKHLRALVELAMVVSGRNKGIFTNPHRPPTNSWIQQFRAWLYTKEKALGDVIPFGGLPGFARPLREMMILTARGLGDIQAIVGSAVGARVTRRLEGKVTGRLIGIGSHTIFASQSFSTGITPFTPMHRLYNREAGAYMNRFMGQSRLFSGGR